MTAGSASRTIPAGVVEALEGRTYGPYPLRVCAEKVSDFVEATNDDPDRWRDFAPPGWAAAALFVVAPGLLTDPVLGSARTAVLHGEQRFEWKRAIPIEGLLNVTGVVSRVRERGAVYFTTFEFEASDHVGPLITGASIFLMSGAAPAVAADEATAPPPPAARGSNDPLPLPGTEFAEIRRSASRADLVRYAAATRDWNPIHWDHAAAVAAGLPTVIVHGLLQAAWLLAAGSAVAAGSAPYADARFRFRSPMTAGSEGTITAEVSGRAISGRLVVGDREIVAANMALR